MLYVKNQAHPFLFCPNETHSTLNDIKEKSGITRLGPVSAQYVLGPLWVCCSGRCLPHGLWREEHVAVVG